MISDRVEYSEGIVIRVGSIGCALGPQDVSLEHRNNFLCSKGVKVNSVLP